MSKTKGELSDKKKLILVGSAHLAGNDTDKRKLAIVNDYYTEIEQKRIAIEMFLAKKLIKLNYIDLLTEVPEGTVSGARLLSWINDRRTQVPEEGYGIIRRYKEAYPEHFERGKWKSENFGYFLGYASDLLKDKEFFGDNKKAYEDFKHSFLDDSWWYVATAVASLKLLEELYLSDGLTSEKAEELLRANDVARKLIDTSIAGITNTIGIEDETERAYLLADVVDNLRDMYEDVFSEQKDNDNHRLEAMIFNYHKPFIEHEVERIRSKSIDGVTKQLGFVGLL